MTCFGFTVTKFSLYRGKYIASFGCNNENNTQTYNCRIILPESDTHP